MQFPIVLGVSARHAHLCREHMDILFGEGSELHVKKPIGQPGSVCFRRTDYHGNSQGFHEAAYHRSSASGNSD